MNSYPCDCYVLKKTWKKSCVVQMLKCDVWTRFLLFVMFSITFFHFNRFNSPLKDSVEKLRGGYMYSVSAFVCLFVSMCVVSWDECV